MCVCVCCTEGKKWSALWLDEPFLFDSQVHLSFLQVSDRVDSRALETPKSCRWDSSSIGWHSKNIKTLHYIYKWWSNSNNNNNNNDNNSNNNNNKSLLEYHLVIPFCHLFIKLILWWVLRQWSKNFWTSTVGSRRGVNGMKIVYCSNLALQFHMCYVHRCRALHIYVVQICILDLSYFFTLRLKSNWTVHVSLM